jgi:hypothetical protein
LFAFEVGFINMSVRDQIRRARSFLGGSEPSLHSDDSVTTTTITAGLTGSGGDAYFSESLPPHFRWPCPLQTKYTKVNCNVIFGCVYHGYCDLSTRETSGVEGCAEVPRHACACSLHSDVGPEALAMSKRGAA